MSGRLIDGRLGNPVRAALPALAATRDLFDGEVLSGRPAKGRSEDADHGVAPDLRLAVIAIGTHTNAVNVVVARVMQLGGNAEVARIADNAVDAEAHLHRHGHKPQRGG